MIITLLIKNINSRPKKSHSSFVIKRLLFNVITIKIKLTKGNYEKLFSNTHI